MTKKEAIERMKTMRWEHATNSCPDRTAFDMAISALSENKGEWIPVNSIDEIPKEGAYWATFCYRGRTWVELISWDSDREYWCDSERWYMDADEQKLIIAYMPYFMLEPYKAEKGGVE